MEIDGTYFTYGQYPEDFGKDWSHGETRLFGHERVGVSHGPLVELGVSGICQRLPSPPHDEPDVATVQGEQYYHHQASYAWGNIKQAFYIFWEAPTFQRKEGILF